MSCILQSWDEIDHHADFALLDSWMIYGCLISSSASVLTMEPLASERCLEMVDLVEAIDNLYSVVLEASNGAIGNVAG